MPIRKPNLYARKLRKNMPAAERKLWMRIRRKQISNFRFRRQHTIGPYIADFACVEVRLVIELDGDQHGFDDGARDQKRDAFMEASGWMVLRFWNHEIYHNIDGVLETILNTAESLGRAKSQPKT